MLNIGNCRPHTPHPNILQELYTQALIVFFQKIIVKLCFQSWYSLNNDWSEVGQLTVTVHGARGLYAMGIGCKADAYCVLELDNSRVQTHTVSSTSDPIWDKNYTLYVNSSYFCIYTLSRILFLWWSPVVPKGL